MAETTADHVERMARLLTDERLRRKAAEETVKSLEMQLRHIQARQDNRIRTDKQEMRNLIRQRKKRANGT